MLKRFPPLAVSLTLVVSVAILLGRAQASPLAGPLTRYSSRLLEP